jgi:hypothetical protein
MSGPGSDPIPRWRADPEYYGKKDPRRAAHLAHIEVQERINARICASAGDGSYAVQVTRRDI